MTVQANTLAKYPSWKDWFNARSSATIINKSNQEMLFQIFKHTISPEKCGMELIEHTETVFLFRHTFGTNRIELFHNMQVTGGNIYTAKKEFSFIQGVGEDNACPVTPDFDILVQLPQETAEPIPTATHLLNVTSTDEVAALNPGQTTSYTPRNFIPVPPFLLNTLNEAISKFDGDAAHILVETAKAFKDFDTAHSNDEDYIDKAKSKSKDVLAWLYLVITNKVTAIPTISCSSKILKSKISNLEQRNLGPNRPAIDSINQANHLEEVFRRPLEILATSSSSTQDFMQRLTQIQNQSNEKSNKSFKKIAPKYQRMLLVASSQGEAIPIELNHEAMEFFSQTSVLNAQIYLNSHLDSLKIECSISTALTTSLMHGCLLWTSSLTPSGLASSVISSLDIIRNDVLHEGIVLDYSTKHEMTSKSLEKLTKTQILFPADIEASIERLRAFHALVDLFFGSLSFPAQGLKKLIHLCSDHKRLLRTKLFLDEMFIAKMHFTVDDRLNQWLEQCCRTDTVTETNLELTNFSSIFGDIQLNKFFCHLPSNIAKIHDRTKSTNDDNDRKTKRSKPSPSQPEKIRNLSQCQDWKLRHSEKWDTIFRNKTRDGPTLSTNCKPCLKFHVKGLCYSDCPFRCSHKSLSSEDKVLTTNFIKELRGE